eukprot:403334199
MEVATQSKAQQRMQRRFLQSNSTSDDQNIESTSDTNFGNTVNQSDQQFNQAQTTITKEKTNQVIKEENNATKTMIFLQNFKEQMEFFKDFSGLYSGVWLISLTDGQQGTQNQNTSSQIHTPNYPFQSQHSNSESRTGKAIFQFTFQTQEFVSEIQEIQNLTKTDQNNKSTSQNITDSINNQTQNIVNEEVRDIIYNELSFPNVIGLLNYNDFRQKQTSIEFDLNPMTHVFTIDSNMGLIKMDGVNATIKKREEMKIIQDSCLFDVLIKANFEQINEQQKLTDKTLAEIEDEEDEEESIDRNKVYRIDLDLTLSKQNSEACFAYKIGFELKKQHTQQLVEKVSNYSFLVTSVCMILVYGILGQIRRTMSNNQVAKTLSVPMLGFSVIWNFCYFSVHFTMALSQEYFHYMSLPAFWFFMISFVFQFRLMIICWKAQLIPESVQYDPATLRKRLIYLYTKFYFFLIIIFLSKDIIMNIPYLLVIFNGSLWVPQIYRQYKMKSKFGPEGYLIYGMSAVHSILPIYLNGCPYNLFEADPNYYLVLAYVGYMGLQIYILKQQQIRNPRFFVPKEWRRDPGAYNYYAKFPRTSGESSQNSVSDQERLEINGGEEECVICMNPLRFEIDKDNNQLQVVGGGDDVSNSDIQNSTSIPQYKKAKEYMKTPCNHKFHVPCLKQWMNIRLECPCCRQVIPPLDDED